MKKNLPSILVLVLIATMWAVSCKKDPTPAPTPDPTPTDTITPVTPGDTLPDTPVNPGDTITPTPGTDTIIPGPGGDTIVPPTPGGDTITHDTIVPPMTGGTKEWVIDFYPSAGGAVFPSLDSVLEWVNRFDTIKLKVFAPSDAWTPSGFNDVRRSLTPYFDVSPKVFGKGWWVTYQILDDAQLNNISVKGMIRSDSAYFVGKGYGIYPQVTGKNATSAQPSYYNGSQGKNTKYVAPRYNGNRVQ